MALPFGLPGPDGMPQAGMPMPPGMGGPPGMVGMPPPGMGGGPGGPGGGMDPALLAAVSRKLASTGPAGGSGPMGPRVNRARPSGGGTKGGGRRGPVGKPPPGM